MTREEAILELETMIAGYAFNADEAMALGMAVSALRPITREQVEKAWRGCKYCDEEWGTCNPITNRFTMPSRGGIRFCPVCGRPLTDEAVQMVMERMEKLYEQTSN